MNQALRLPLTLALLLARVAEAAPARPKVISLAQLQTTLKQHQGKPLLLHVWASWCAPCVDELPLVARLARDARTRGIAVYSVSLDKPAAARHVAWVLARKGGGALNATIVRMDDPDALVARLDPDWEGEIPAFFAYDRDGKLQRAHVGEMTQEKFEAFVAAVTPPPVKK
jgi:thiol-disulfide isomerase/thioredoxin